LARSQTGAAAIFFPSWILLASTLKYSDKTSLSDATESIFEGSVGADKTTAHSAERIHICERILKFEVVVCLCILRQINEMEQRKQGKKLTGDRQ
jgi:hypothetical protein